MRAGDPPPGGPRAGGASLELSGFGWRPEDAERQILRDVTLRIRPGERVVLAGPSGAGKSTLLRALAGLVNATEPGEQTGAILVGGVPAAETAAAGLLLQDPVDAQVAEHAGRDTAFGLENLGVPSGAMPALVLDAHRRARFPYGPARRVDALSGGEAQRLALAGVLVLRPKVLLLDEPTSMLDPAGAEAVRAAILDVVRETGATMVAALHHLDGWLEQADRIVVLGRDGRIVHHGPAGAFADADPALLDTLGLWRPGLPPPRPLEVSRALCAPASPPPTDAVLLAEGLTALPPARPGPDPVARRPVLEGFDLSVGAGRILAITGPSGAGKSTLTALLAGLRRPDAGRVRTPTVAAGEPDEPGAWDSPQLAEFVGWVPQEPSVGLLEATVLDEVLRTSRALGQPRSAAVARAEGLLAALGLDRFADRDPRGLSGGELRRLSLATAVSHGPAVLVLDEPTVGQDRQTWSAIAGIVLAARDAGCAVVVATHDPLLIALADDRVDLPDRPPALEPAPPPAASRPLASRAGPLALLGAGILLIAGSAGITSVPAGAAGLAAVLAAAPVVVGRQRVPARRLLPGLVAVASIGFSTWLLAPAEQATAGVTAAMRIAFFVLPGAVLAARVDASALGDHLAQRLHLPVRPVIAAVAAWQQFGRLTARWQQVRDARRVRGVAGRGPRARLTEFTAATSAVVVQSIRQAARMAIAMEARRFSTAAAMRARTWAAPAPWHGADTALLALAAVVALVPVLADLLLQPR